MNNIAFNIALPLLTAFLLPIISTGSKSAARFIGPFVLLAMLWFALAYLNVLDHPVALALGGFLPPLGISFHLDKLSLLMASIIPLMMLLLWPYSNTEGYREESLLLLLAGAASGMALSGDLFNIYVFYELLSVASFGLAAANRNAAAFAATFRYVVISGLGTVLALTGIALIYTQTGTLNLAHIGLLASQLNNPVGLSAFALIVIGIGVKAEIFLLMDGFQKSIPPLAPGSAHCLQDWFPNWPCWLLSGYWWWLIKALKLITCYWYWAYSVSSGVNYPPGVRKT